jgi:hypothetical protein
MNKKFIVSYVLDYVHQVSVGIEAKNKSDAIQIAEQAFNEASIWDNTEAMPLLSDDYLESGDEGMVWECEQVDQFPEPDHSVRTLNREQAAFRVCRGLVEAYQRGEASAGSIDWEELDLLVPVALMALDKKSMATSI